MRFVEFKTPLVEELEGNIGIYATFVALSEKSGLIINLWIKIKA